MRIGEALAEGRRQAGLTVTQVSQRTRIREPVIRGIENGDYSACGGDFYARGHIRSIAKVVGADPRPLIREYDTTQRAPRAIPAADVVRPVRSTRVNGRRPRNQALAVAVALALELVVALGFVAYHFTSSSRHAASAAQTVRTQPVTHRHAGPSGPNPAPKATQTANPATAAAPPRPTVTARILTPVRAAALGPHGDGDNPQNASLAIDGKPATAWHTDWYTSARFGNLYPGTGLLLDLGRPVTITGAQINLGSSPGADFQLRAGGAPAPADLPPVASAANAAGVVRLRLTTPAHGRYVLIWFTRLPRDPAGTFQASVHDVRLEGRS